MLQAGDFGARSGYKLRHRIVSEALHFFSILIGVFFLINDEVKKVVFNLNGNSSCGPDDLLGKFFHVWWDIVGADICRMGSELETY